MAEQTQTKLDGDMKKKHILFGNPVFHSGLNFTVRDGGDWCKRKDIKVGDIIEMYDTKDVYLGVCVITHKLICTMQDLPPFVFSKSNDPGCKNPIILMDLMSEVYHREFRGIDIVTAIGFVPRVTS
jgi:hypothetical protein